MLRFIILVVTVITALCISVKPLYASTIKINEFYSAGSTSSNPDWVEVYYNGVDITLYQLRDAAGNTKNLSEGSYGGNFATVNWSNRLNNDGDTIKLVLIFNPDSPIDQVTYGGSGDISTPNSGQSAGRNPDGTGNWTIFSTSSKGSTNNTSPTSTPTPTPSPTPTSSPTPTPTPKPTSIATPIPTHTPIPTANLSPTPHSSVLPSTVSQASSSNQSEGLSFAWARRIASTSYRIASVAAATTSATEPAKVNTKNQKQTNPVVWAGLIFIFAGAGLIGYIYLKKNAKIHL